MIAVELVAHWFVYFASFVLMEGRTNGLITASFLVATWGSPDLLFAALAPPLAARAQR